MRLLAALLIASSTFGVACTRPSEEDCRQAIANIRALAGTDSDDFGDPDAAIRSCRANASKASVKCVIRAKTEADLEKCEGGVFDEMFAKEKKAAEEDEEKAQDK